MKNVIIVALVALVAIGGASSLFAVSRMVETTADVEVRVWQGVADGSLYLSTRPAGGAWTTHNAALDMSQLSASGRFRQSSFVTVTVPVSVAVDGPPPMTAPDPTAGDGAEQYGGWRRVEGEDIAGSYVAYVNTATEHSGYTWQEAPLLAVDCSGPSFATRSVGVFTPWLLHGGDDEADVKYRFGGMSGPVTERWWSNEESDSTVVPLTETFATHLVTATGTLYLQFISLWDGDSHTATFDVTGAQDVAAALPCS